MTSISKKINYFDELDDIGNKYSNAHLSTIRMRTVDMKSNIYIDFNKENKNKNTKFEVGGHVRLSKYKNIFAKGYTQNPSEDVFVVKRL